MLPKLASATTTMLFDWLVNSTCGKRGVTIPTDLAAERLDSGVGRRMIEALRTMALLLSGHSPEGAKAYLARSMRSVTPIRSRRYTSQLGTSLGRSR